MADRTITAEAIITARDGTGDTLAKLGAKMRDLSKSMLPSSRQMGDLAEKAKAMADRMAALDKLQGRMTGFAKARGIFNEQRTALQLHAQAMKQAEAPTAAMQRRYEQLQGSVKRSAAAFEQQKAAMLDAKRVAEQYGRPVGRISVEQARLRTGIEATTRAIEHQAVAERRAAAAHQQAGEAAERRAHSVAHHGMLRYDAGAAAGYVGAHGVATVIERTAEAGAERQHVIGGMLKAGMPMEEVQRAQTLAGQVSKSAPNMSVSSIMELHKEARSAVQHPEEVFALMPDLARAASVLKGMGAENVNIADLVKGGETLGLMNDPKRFHAYLNGQVKAMQVMGRTIDTSQIYEAAKYSKSAGATLSDEFINTTMPSLIQEMHGSSAGDALAAVASRWRGGLNHQHLATQKLLDVGLIGDPKQIKRSKSGEILGYGGKLKNDDLLSSDFGRYINEVVDPALATKGITALQDRIKFYNEMLPRTAANVARILSQQKEALRQLRENYRAAPDADQTIEIDRKDPTVGVQSLKASLNDLASAVSLPLMEDAAKGINGTRPAEAALCGLSDGLRS